jgi:hypothetical protein
MIGTADLAVGVDVDGEPVGTHLARVDAHLHHDAAKLLHVPARVNLVGLDATGASILAPFPLHFPVIQARTGSVFRPAWLPSQTG